MWLHLKDESLSWRLVLFDAQFRTDQPRLTVSQTRPWQDVMANDLKKAIGWRTRTLVVLPRHYW